MKKVVTIYILMLILIAFLIVAISLPLIEFSYVIFSRKLHIILDGSNSLLMFLMFVFCNFIYAKTKDERLIIMAGGFLIGSIFNCVHIITVKSFPFDFLSIANLQKNPSLVYLLLANLVLSFSIYFTIMHKPSSQKINFRLKTYSFYFALFLILSISPLMFRYFFPELIFRFNIVINALEFINYSLYIMLAFMIINIRQASNLTFFPMFTTGLAISGLAGLFYINPQLTPANEISAHLFQAIGLIFLLLGIPHFRTYAKFLRFKDELAAYLCLMIIAFYIIFVSISSGIYHIVFPSFSAYIFIEILLIFQFIVYLFANNITKPITNITEALSEYTPGERPLNIPVIRQDEIGILTKKINETSMLSWQKISEISKLVDRERSIIKIFETIRRISNQNVIKNTIIEEIRTAFEPDECFIVLYDINNDILEFDRYAENLPSQTLKDFEDKNANFLNDKTYNNFLKKNMDFYFTNIEEYITEASLQGTEKEKILREYNIKSCYNVPIYYANILLGCLVLQYKNDYKVLDKDDLSYLKTIATQIGIAINLSNRL